MKTKFNSRGFTLIELIIVVVIIGILAGIAIPTYQNIMLRHRGEQCINNIRLIFNAWKIFNMKGTPFAPAPGGVFVPIADINARFDINIKENYFGDSHEPGFTMSYERFPSGEESYLLLAFSNADPNISIKCCYHPNGTSSHGQTIHYDWSGTYEWLPDDE